MSAPGFRLIDGAGKTVAVTIDGEPHELPAGRSLLAGLLTQGAPVDFFCAIGQCQRCRARINGQVELACLLVPRLGDVIETDG